METNEIMRRCDHTLLKQTAVWEQIKKLIDEGIRWHTASVCIPPSFVRQAAEYADGRIAVCTVIGFPNGYTQTAVKKYETEQALREGTDEIDMVINLGWAKEGRWEAVEEEIRRIKQVCGEHILKVIVETCFLDDDEKLAACRAVCDAGADFIKTSTGFGPEGASPEDVSLFARYGNGRLGIKASGGISSLEEAERFIALGADRIGASRLVKAAEERREAGK